MLWRMAGFFGRVSRSGGGSIAALLPYSNDQSPTCIRRICMHASAHGAGSVQALKRLRHRQWHVSFSSSIFSHFPQFFLVLFDLLLLVLVVVVVRVVLLLLVLLLHWHLSIYEVVLFSSTTYIPSSFSTCMRQHMSAYVSMRHLPLSI